MFEHKAKSKVLQEKENLGFGLKIIRRHLTYSSAHLYGSYSLEVSCSVHSSTSSYQGCPAEPGYCRVSCVDLGNLAQECVHEIQQEQIKGVP